MVACDGLKKKQEGKAERGDTIQSDQHLFPIDLETFSFEMK